MAVRFDTAGDFLTRVTDLPSISNFTIMGWFKITTGSGSYQCFASLGKTDAGTFYYMGTNSAGTVMMEYNGSSQYTTGGVALTAGIWYYCAMVCAGTGTNNFRYYVNGKHIVLGNGNASVTAVEMYLGQDDSGSDQLNGACEDVLVYNTALTQVDIQKQMQQRKPILRAALNGWYPFDADLKDKSGRANDFTEHGTVTYEPGPGTVLNRRNKKRVLKAPAAAGGGTFIFRKTLSGIGSKVGSRQVHGW